MKRDEAGVSERVTNVTAAAQPSRRSRGPAMHFRMVGHDQHRAMVDGTTFSCTRESITTEAVVTYRWSAFKDTTLLKGDCRTLNEAKIWCRAALSDGVAAVLSSDLLAPGTAGAPDAPPPVVPAGEPCERGG